MDWYALPAVLKAIAVLIALISFFFLLFGG